MADDNKLTIYEEAHIDYLSGMKYKEIATKYGVATNTVKTWRSRYGWKRKNEPQKVLKVSGVQGLGNKLPEEVKKRAETIKKDLIKDYQITSDRFLDMVDRYIKFYFVQKYLEEDIESRGVSINWSNGGKQQGVKKNDSITELTKVSAEMRSILSDLEKSKPKVEDDDEI